MKAFYVVLYKYMDILLLKLFIFLFCILTITTFFNKKQVSAYTFRITLMNHISYEYCFIFGFSLFCINGYYCHSHIKIDEKGYWTLKTGAARTPALFTEYESITRYYDIILPHDITCQSLSPSCKCISRSYYCN